MKVVIEFYRIRITDEAHAVVGREAREAHDLADAIEIGQRLSQTLDMPQRPDAMTIIGADGQALHSGVIDAMQGKKASIMKRQNNEASDGTNAAAVGAWENEGGARGRDSRGHQYGRRVEADRSWTIYHVFTGVPASAEGQTMTGLNRADATSGMLFLNLRNAAHRKERVCLSCPEDGAITAAQP